MKLTGWRKLGLLIAFILLFFPCTFILIEMPTETKIYQNWARGMLWKTQAETSEYQKLGVWYIRQQYHGVSERELIGALEARFKDIDYSTIRHQHTLQLDRLRINQSLVVAEAIFVYLFVVTALYASAWIIARILQGRRPSRRSQHD